MNESAQKKQRSLEYHDVLLKKWKQHDDPVKRLQELKKNSERGSQR